MKSLMKKCMSRWKPQKGTRFVGKLVSFTFFAGIVFQFTSCGTSERIIYFQDGGSDSTMQVRSTYTPVFKTDDLLQILVTGPDEDAVAPFNLPLIGPTSANNGYATGIPAKVGYLVDNKGMINMPVIGQVKVAGMSRSEATAMLEEMLAEYIDHPVVQIQIENYKVTVLGDVKNPGTFKIPNERITILEAIGLAGDLKMTGVRHNVLVIRENDGIKTEYRVDLTKKEVFTSPVYYLEQNDVVYVEPNAASRTESTIWRTTGAIFISLTSLVVTTVTLITR